MKTAYRFASFTFPGLMIAALTAACSVPPVTFTGIDGGDDDDGADTTPPDTTITAAPPMTDNSATAIFEFTSTEGGTFQCGLDGAAFASCTSPHTVSGLVSGQHAFQVRAVDAANNIDPSPASHTWTVDLLLPDTTIDSGPTGAVNATDATFTFSSPNGGGTVSFDCSLDSAAFLACTSPTTFSSLANGPHDLRVRARSATGQVDPSPATRAWTVDTIAPDTTIVNGPTGTTATSSASFTFSSNESGVMYECDVDGAGFEACPSPHNLAGLSDGGHSLAVRAVDAAGNRDSSPASRSWTVDTMAPDTSLTQTPVSPSAADVTFAFTSTEVGASFECSLDGAAFAGCASPRMLTGLADGSHNFRVRAVDLAGNQDATPATHTWMVDTSVPDTQITAGPSGATNQQAGSFTFVALNSAGATLECSLDGAPFTTCTSPFSFSGLIAGMHTFRARARSTTGVYDPSPAQQSWTIDLTPPSTTITTGPSGPTASTSASFAFTSDDAAATFECNLDGAGFMSCSASPMFVGLAQGNHSLSVRAVDAAGNRDATPATRSWIVDTVSPETTITASPPNPSNATNPQFAFSSEAGALFECSLDGAAFASCSSPHVITVGNGSHNFQVRAYDAAGNRDPTPATYAWTTDTIAPNTTIQSGPQNPTAQTMATFTMTSTEPGSFECSLEGGPFQPCSSPYTLLVPDGDHVMTIRAVDPAGNADPSPATWTWKSDTMAPGITINSPTAAHTAPYALLDFVVSESASITCQFDGTGPFMPCVSPTDIYRAPGQHSVAVRAIDGVGNMSTATRVWNVTCGQPPEMPGAILSLHMEDPATSQSVANAVDLNNYAIKGRDLSFDSLDPTTSAGRYGNGLRIAPVAGDYHQVLRWDRSGLFTRFSTWTLELWVRPSDGGIVVNHANLGGSGLTDVNFWSLAAGTLITLFQEPNNSAQLPTLPITFGQWNYVAITFDGVQLMGWVNGNSATITPSFSPFFEWRHIDFGAQGTFDNGTSTIEIDEVTLSTRALTVAELQERYCPAP